MTLPSTGSISLGQVRTELTQTGVISLGSVGVRGLFNIPGGSIRLSDGYGKAYIAIAGTLTSTASGPTVGWRFGTDVDIFGTTIVIGAPSLDSHHIVINNGTKLVYDIDIGGLYRYNTSGTLLGSHTGSQNNYDAVGSKVSISSNRYVMVSHAQRIVYLQNNTNGATASSVYIPDIVGNPSVEVEGDYTIIGISAFSKGGGITSSGQVQVLRFPLTTLAYKLTPPTPITNGRFGESVSANGTYLCVSEPGAGMVHVYNLLTGSLIRTFSFPNTYSGTFGSCIAVYGDYLVVGIPGYDLLQYTNIGSAFVYNIATGDGPIVLGQPLTTIDGKFGCSVDINLDFIAVGSPGQGNGGRVYVYSTHDIENVLPDSMYILPVRTIDNPTPSPAATNEFGYSVALYSSTLVVGAPGVNNNAGKAYIFN